MNLGLGPPTPRCDRGAPGRAGQLGVGDRRHPGSPRSASRGWSARFGSCLPAVGDVAAHCGTGGGACSGVEPAGDLPLGLVAVHPVPRRRRLGGISRPRQAISMTLGGRSWKWCFEQRPALKPPAALRRAPRPGPPAGGRPDRAQEWGGEPPGRARPLARARSLWISVLQCVADWAGQRAGVGSAALLEERRRAPTLYSKAGGRALGQLRDDTQSGSGHAPSLCRRCPGQARNALKVSRVRSPSRYRPAAGCRRRAGSALRDSGPGPTAWGLHRC